MRRRAANIDMEKVSLSENLKDVDRMAKKLQIDKETVIEVRRFLAGNLCRECNCEIKSGHEYYDAAATTANLALEKKTIHNLSMLLVKSVCPSEVFQLI